MIQLSYSMLSSQVSPTLCTFAITSILIPSILVQGQLDVGSTSIGKQIIENLRLNSSLEQLLEETYETSSALQIKAKLLKQMKDDLIQCQGLITDLKDNGDAKNTQSCFSIKGRYTGTDLIDSRIKELRTLSTEECQEKCKEHPDCNYFLYFSLDHYQRFKHNTCRLLRFKGQLKPAEAGHISGPKRCMTFREKEDTIKNNNLLLSKLQQFYCGQKGITNCQKYYRGGKGVKELLKKTFGEDHYNIIIALIAEEDLNKADQEWLEKCSYDSTVVVETTTVVSLLESSEKSAENKSAAAGDSDESPIRIIDDDGVEEVEIITEKMRPKIREAELGIEDMIRETTTSRSTSYYKENFEIEVGIDEMEKSKVPSQSNLDKEGAEDNAMENKVNERTGERRKEEFEIEDFGIEDTIRTKLETDLTTKQNEVKTDTFIPNAKTEPQVKVETEPETQSKTTTVTEFETEPDTDSDTVDGFVVSSSSSSTSTGILNKRVIFPPDPILNTETEFETEPETDIDVEPEIPSNNSDADILAMLQSTIQNSQKKPDDKEIKQQQEIKSDQYDIPALLKSTTNGNRKPKLDSTVSLVEEFGIEQHQQIEIQQQNQKQYLDTSNESFTQSSIVDMERNKKPISTTTTTKAIPTAAAVEVSMTKSQPEIEITKSEYNAALGNTTADVSKKIQQKSDEQRNKKELETYGSSNVDIEVEMKKNEGSEMTFSGEEIGDEEGLAAGTILNPLDLAKEEEVQLPNFQQGGTLVLLHRKKVISFHFLSFTEGLESSSIDNF